MSTSKLFKIFVVEDDPWYGQFLKYHLELNPDNKVFLYTSGAECLQNLSLFPDLICLDVGLPDNSGDTLLRSIRRDYAELPVVVIGGKQEVSLAENMLNSGAKAYLVKDDSTKQVLWNFVQEIKSTKQESHEEVAQQLKSAQVSGLENRLVGKSEALRQVFSRIEKAIQSNINVSITGETGTGKEVVAQAIHYESERKNKPFVAINMAALPKELVESELFGHEKGAFTGALHQKIGKFEEANGGTLFLDEIAEMDISLQSKILRALQEREVSRLGGKQPVKFNARLIVATNRDLREEVRKGNFREDLFYRIIGLPIHLPPLREREDDILLIAEHFIGEYISENKILSIPKLSDEASKKLMQYPFPGNVRELKANIELACVLCNGDTIEAEDIALIGEQARKVSTEVAQKTLRAYNIDIITNFLREHDHDVQEVARLLDIGKSSIYTMIKNGEIQIEKKCR